MKKEIPVCKPQFYCIKVGFKREFTAWTCLHDVTFNFFVILFDSFCLGF